MLNHGHFSVPFQKPSVMAFDRRSCWLHLLMFFLLTTFVPLRKGQRAGGELREVVLGLFRNRGLDERRHVHMLKNLKPVCWVRPEEVCLAGVVISRNI